MSNPLPALDGTTENPLNPLAQDLAGKKLGDFQLIRKIGQGGMGQVYLATQLSLKRQVAVKLLKPELAANEIALKRFKAEAEAVARLTHGNIVQVYAIGEEEGIHFMALEYVEGKNLKEYLLRKGPLEANLALSFIRQIAAALQRASELGFVHRDIKPENILLTRKGEVKVTDFGLSRCFSADEALHLTQSGVTMGTPLYMAPEQVQGKAVDPRSDIYSFGITYYHMLAGEPPFRGTTAFEVALHHVQTAPRPLTEFRPEISPEFLGIIHKMMAKKPEDRFQSAREILREIAKIRDVFDLSTVPTAMPIAEPLPNGFLGTTSNSQPFAGIDRSSTIVPTMATTVPQATIERKSRRKLWLYFGGGFFVLAALRGADETTTQSDNSANTSVKVLETEDAVTIAANVFREQEKSYLRKIDDKSYKFDAALEESIRLLMLYIEKKKFEEARAFLDSLPKRGAFTEVARTGLEKIARLAQAGGLELLANLGKGIILAHEDKAKESNDILYATLTRNRFKKPGEFSPADAMLNSLPTWRKELAIAVDRNFKNFGDEGMNPFLERYRDALPLRSVAVEPKR